MSRKEQNEKPASTHEVSSWYENLGVLERENLLKRIADKNNEAAEPYDSLFVYLTDKTQRSLKEIYKTYDENEAANKPDKDLNPAGFDFNGIASRELTRTERDNFRNLISGVYKGISDTLLFKHNQSPMQVASLLRSSNEVYNILISMPGTHHDIIDNGVNGNSNLFHLANQFIIKKANYYDNVIHDN